MFKHMFEAVAMEEVWEEGRDRLWALVRDFKPVTVNDA